MYAVKVEQGRERPEVRKISTGFLPSYRVYTGDERSVRWLVVPGYVFTLSKTRKAEPVPDEEWEIIDKISSSAISTLDKDGKIVSGPLKGLDPYVTKTGKDHVQLCVNLFGEARTYRLPYRIAEETEEAVEAKESKAKMADAASGKKELSEEQIAAALKRAEKVGIHAAGQGVRDRLADAGQDQAAGGGCSSGEEGSGGKDDHQKRSGKAEESRCDRKRAEDREGRRTEAVGGGAGSRERRPPETGGGADGETGKSKEDAGRGAG